MFNSFFFKSISNFPCFSFKITLLQPPKKTGGALNDTSISYAKTPRTADVDDTELEQIEVRDRGWGTAVPFFFFFSGAHLTPKRNGILTYHEWLKFMVIESQPCIQIIFTNSLQNKYFRLSRGCLELELTRLFQSHRASGL